MTPEQEMRLRNQSMRGRVVRFGNKGGGPGVWNVGTVEDEVFIIVADYKHMIQRIKFRDGQGWGGNQYAYRISYYTFDAQVKNIKWGQYHSLLAESELKDLLQQARQKGWDIF